MVIQTLQNRLARSQRYSFKPKKDDDEKAPSRKIDAAINQKTFALRRYSREWVITISLILIIFHFFPRNIDGIDIFGVTTEPINGYKDIINVVLMLGLYQLATRFSNVLPGLSRRGRLTLSLVTSSEKSISIEDKKSEVLDDENKFYLLTKITWDSFDKVAESTQYLAVTLFFLLGLYQAIGVLHLSAKDPLLPKHIHFLVLILSCLFLSATIFRSLQILSFLSTHFYHQQRKKKEEQLNKVKEAQEIFESHKFLLIAINSSIIVANRLLKRTKRFFWLIYYTDTSFRNLEQYKKWKYIVSCEIKQHFINWENLKKEGPYYKKLKPEYECLIRVNEFINKFNQNLGQNFDCTELDVMTLNFIKSHGKDIENLRIFYKCVLCAKISDEIKKDLNNCLTDTNERKSKRKRQNTSKLNF